MVIVAFISVISLRKSSVNKSILPAPQENRKICIPFSREEESIFQNFSRFERYSFYRVKNATIYAPDNIVDLFSLSEAKDTWYREEIYKTPRLYEFYLFELLRKEIKGDFSDEIKREIEIAREMRGGYLEELVSWIDSGMSTEEMINLTLEKLMASQEDRLINSYRYGMLLVLMREISPEGYSKDYWNYVLARTHVPSKRSKVIEDSYKAMLEEYTDQYNRMKIYLSELIKRGNLSYETVNITLDKLSVAMDLSTSSARYYGAYIMLDLISENGTYSLEYCYGSLENSLPSP